MKMFAMRDSKGALHEDTVLCEVHSASLEYRESAERTARESNPDDGPVPDTWHEIADDEWGCVRYDCTNYGTSKLPRRTPGDYYVGSDIRSGIAICTTHSHNCFNLIGLSCLGAAAEEDERYANACFSAASTAMERALCHILVLILQSVDDNDLAAIAGHCRTALAAAYGIAPDKVATPDLSVFDQPTTAACAQ